MPSFDDKYFIESEAIMTMVLTSAGGILSLLQAQVRKFSKSFKLKVLHFFLSHIIIINFERIYDFVSKEDEPELQIYALKRLNEDQIIRQFWAEIADALEQIEILHEDTAFKVWIKKHAIFWQNDIGWGSQILKPL